MPHLIVSGIVSARNMQPFVQLYRDNEVIAQLTMAEARNIANDLINMCARTEADAMIVKFFGERDLPQAAAAALLTDFRDFRSKLDAQVVQKSEMEGNSFDTNA